ncbi:MAG: hypothetical protein R3F54_13595 [Alphaproteobacteria bacterium]
MGVSFLPLIVNYITFMAILRRYSCAALFDPAVILQEALMSKRTALLMIAAIAALLGAYQLSASQSDGSDGDEVFRGNCVEGQKCG